MSAKIRLIIFVFRNYGQIPKIDVLPVTEDCILRANPKNRRFARNREAAFYGHIPRIDILPVTED
ncbi:hypothetical protein FC25_GL002052 [Ligilactobacillus ruminis DSM 20403 = NBRC 102161]|nr:hypothetical protein FC25_GL002052 [Ligilactobacillus ruminis DSM 20403 = NBRC 102161]